MQVKMYRINSYAMENGKSTMKITNSVLIELKRTKSAIQLKRYENETKRVGKRGELKNQRKYLKNSEKRELFAWHTHDLSHMEIY